MGGRMAQEENIFGCSYSAGGGSGGGRGGGGGAGSGGCRSKKIKPKKVPQRGLGVAQLEKIRLEEQQKKESVNISSPGDATSFLAVHKFRPPFHNSVPLQPPPPPSSNLSSPNALYRHVQSVPNLEILQESCSVSKHSNVSGGEIGSRAISSPRLWGGEYNLAVERQRLDHHGFAFDLQSYESNTNTNMNMNTNTPVLSPPILPQRSHHFQPPPSMVQVNSPSGISSSSALSSHLEPPSNQSSRRNNYATQWTDEDKMVGMKRSYPFSLGSPPPHSTHCSFRPTFAASSSKTDELALCSSGYTAIEEPRNKSIRVSPLLERMPIEVTRDEEGLNVDFLSLAPPSSNLQHHHPSDYHLEDDRSQMHQAESSGSVKQSFNFFPVKLPRNVRNGDDEEGDTIDLNLKL